MLVTRNIDIPIPRTTASTPVKKNDLIGILLTSMSMYKAVAVIAKKNPNFYAAPRLIGKVDTG